MGASSQIGNDVVYPKVNSRRWHLWQLFVKEGGMTLDELICNHGMFGMAKRHMLDRELMMLCDYKVLKLIDETYIAINAERTPVVEPNLVPSREPFPFKPLKDFYPKVSPRGQPIEKRSFQTCTGNQEWREIK